MPKLSIRDRWELRKLNGAIDWSNDVPRHIAMMMDGNGRWAVRRGLPRTAGHYAGMKAMRETIRDCAQIGISFLTLYAFSTENWKRPQEEVDYIIGLVDEYVNDEMIAEMNEAAVRISFIGDIRRFPPTTREAMSRAADATRSNRGMTVNFAMNYGGRHEIVQAIKSYAAGGENDLTEEGFERYLYTAGCPSPELIIRTSGERRLSGFLLWQSAQSEIWFTNDMWPSFNKRLLYAAIYDYQQRKKRQRA